MKIFQLILSNPQYDDYRYAQELYTCVTNYLDNNTITQYILEDKQEITKSIIDLINSYDYLFIHGLNKDKNQYIPLYKFITCKKILFITEQYTKQFLSYINLEYIHPLISNCYKIVFNVNNNEMYQLISRFNNKNLKNFIQLDLLYNYSNDIIDIEKNKEIVQISNNGINSKYDLFIKLFENKKNITDNLVWKIYGLTKNLQTLSIDKLFIDKTTNTESTYTNVNTNIICNDKINICKTINNEELKNQITNTYFVCYFDDYSYINYTFLDIIYCGTIPILFDNNAKKIMINKTQSLYDIITCIYINKDDINIITINKYIKSINTYKSTILKNINVFNNLFNSEQNVLNLFKNITEENDKES